MNPGYIYILQNPSLSESHLKIGRTERDPDERAAEISRATGVPTPYEVVWWSESVDCHRAESLLHQYLDAYRTNTSREFFDLDLDEAIKASKRAIRQSGGRTGGIVYLIRRLAGWTFQGIVRPLLRLPVQLVLLAILILWWILKSVLLLIGGILRGVFSVLAAIFSSTAIRSEKRKKRRRTTASHSRQGMAAAMQRNPFYLKEIIGAILLGALAYFLLVGDGVARFREILSELTH